MTTTTYRTSIQGRRSEDHDAMEGAIGAVQTAMGWTGCVVSDRFAAGAREGKRGSVYGVECYETEAGLASRPDGDPHAPRILIVRGDEGWAMGREAD